MDADSVVRTLESKCEGSGVSCHPFQLGWYHDKVAPAFHFPHSGDTLAVLLVSTPPMFEQLFLPFLRSPHYSPASLDPLDQCFKHFFNQLKALFRGGEEKEEEEVEAIHDFEMCANRRPRVLVQTAGHFAGVARYYQREDLKPDPWSKSKNVYGVSVHPRYGGWFAFRGVLIFRKVKASHLKFVEPEDCVPEQEMRKDLLQKFNWNWQDWTYRDVVVGGARERYSEQQKLYFGTKPGERLALISQLSATPINS